MSSASPFSVHTTEEVENLMKSGSVSSSFNADGSLLLDYLEGSVSSSLIAFPLSSIVFSNDQIVKKFEVNFIEFADVIQVTSESVTQSFEAETVEKSVAESADTSSVVDTGATVASKDVILELRQQLGQGTSDSDFDSEFPYLPLN
jgi:hypothetical protein